MSWYGQHATVSKQEVKAIYPKACKMCVYFIRFFGYHMDCSRCGNNPAKRIRIKKS